MKTKIEGVPNIELEDEVEKLAMETFEHGELESLDGSYNSFHIQSESFIKGYKANKAKYTEEQMYDAIIDGILDWNDYGGTAKEVANKILQSINSIKEITVDENFKPIKTKKDETN